ncbi:GTPase-activating protein AGE2 PWA37_003666 [Arxiozyma heterogenica]|uniref:Arf-GAP domain-containing protein n=1 Tax=Arxiozyma heterogenica TaxID=278026 RepID=A0AAN7WMD7_9SACH|nr:hypothetical protein RI543_001057 [Kazachstania heterogenica]
MTSIQVKKALNALLRDPGNSKCADCKTQQHPRWASWSLGVFICIKCAGIHRSLGTHISKVKSVDLDTWKEEHLTMLIKMQNNDLANEYYENKLSHDTESQNKLSKMLMDTNKLSLFIRNKYEYKKWCGLDKIVTKDTNNSDNDKNTGKKSNIDLLNSEHTTTFVSSINNGSIKSNVEEDTSAQSTLINQNNLHHPYLKLNQIGTQSQPNIVSSNTNSNRNIMSKNDRPDLKRSILSLYSKPKKTSGMHSMTMPSLGDTKFQANNIMSTNNTSGNSTTSVNSYNNTNNSTVSLDDNELFKNVWQ